MTQDFARFDEGYFWRNGLYEEPDTVAKLVDIISNILKPNQTVLDVGCGRGHLVAGLRERGFLAYGIDPSAFAASTTASPDFTATLPFGQETPWEPIDWDLVVFWNVAHVIGLQGLVDGLLGMRDRTRNILIDWGLTPDEDFDPRFPHVSLTPVLCRRMGFNQHHDFAREAQNIGWGFCGGQTDKLATPPEWFTSIVITPTGEDEGMGRLLATIDSLAALLGDRAENAGEVVSFGTVARDAGRIGGWPCRQVADYDELEPEDWICHTIGDHVCFLPAGRVATAEMLRETEGWQSPAAILVRESNVGGHETAVRGIQPSRPRLIVRSEGRMLLGPCDDSAGSAAWGSREAILCGQPKREGLEVSIGEIELPGREPVARRPAVTGLASLCYDVIAPLFGEEECDGLVACPVGQDISIFATTERCRCIDLRFLARQYIPLVVEALGERTEVFVSSEESEDPRFVQIPLTVPWWNLMPQKRRGGGRAVAWLGHDAVAWEFVAATEHWRRLVGAGVQVHCVGLSRLEVELPFVSRLHPGGDIHAVGDCIDLFIVPETEPFHTVATMVANAMGIPSRRPNSQTWEQFAVPDLAKPGGFEEILDYFREGLPESRAEQIEASESIDEYAIWEQILR